MTAALLYAIVYGGAAWALHVIGRTLVDRRNRGIDRIIAGVGERP